MSDPLITDLRQQIAGRQVVAIIGAGVSIGATGGAVAASWTGLLCEGIRRCESVANPRPKPGWGNRQRAALESGDLDDLLGVAEQVASRLGAPDGGEYRRWLRESVGALALSDRAVLEALRDLGVPIATTNYDDLIEQVTFLPPVTWRDGAIVQRVIRGDEKGILHLHGHWKQPESVILGIRSYEAVLGDAHAQAIQAALAATRGFLFIGCGEGLDDPNFGALRTMIRQVFAGSEYRHFRLCLDRERDEVQSRHPPEERVFAVPYGPGHQDLAPFLRRLRPAAPVPPAAAAEPCGRFAPLPARPRCFGRDALIEDLVGTLLLEPPPPVPVLGGPGFGKSTFCLAALHDPRVAGRFGERRYFVRCDGADTAGGILKQIALTLDLPVGPNLGQRVDRALAETRTALVLDNAETPWEADALATEDVLGGLSTLPGLALVATVRGQQRPHGPAWRECITVTPLGLEDSRKVFLAIAGQRHAADPRLDELLKAVEGIPLAIELLAYAAEAEPDLDGLWRRWQEERVALLRRADGRTRTVNAVVSFELSIAGRRMTDEARRLLSLLAILPDGIAGSDLPKLAPGYGLRAAATLRQVGLAFDEGGHLRVLAPIREHVAERHPPPPESLAPVLGHYIGMAQTLGERVGWEGGGEAARLLAAEARNIEEILSRGLDLPDPAPAIEAAIAYGNFLRFSGVGTPRLLDRAQRIARERDDPRLEGRCTERLGDIALARSDHDAARARYEAALALHRRVGGVLGEANCIRGLGDLAQRRSDPDQAQAHYETALALYRRVGAVLGEANCIKGLGDLALDRSDPDQAQAHYEAALALYRRVGAVLGEANCISRLGDLALRRSDPDTARARFEAALGLYGRIPDPYSIGGAHRRLAGIAASDEDRRRHVGAAREAWRSIRRDDLIVRWLDAEFGGEGGGGGEQA